MSSGEPESASLQRSKNISCRRAGAAFGLGALQGSEIGVIFLSPWHGRGGCLGKLASGASLLEDVALDSSTLYKRQCILAWYMVQGQDLVLSREESPQVMSLFLSKPFLHCDLSLCVLLLFGNRAWSLVTLPGRCHCFCQALPWLWFFVHL